MTDDEKFAAAAAGTASGWRNYKKRVAPLDEELARRHDLFTPDVAPSLAPVSKAGAAPDATPRVTPAVLPSESQTPTKLPAVQQAAPVVAPIAPPTQLLSGITPFDPQATVAGARPLPSFGGKPLDTSLLSANPAVAPTTTPAASAGRRLGGALRTLGAGALGLVRNIATGGTSGMVAGQNRSANVARPVTGEPLINPVLDYAGGVAQGALGRSQPAGVSRSQVAGIEQPTKANPVPITPTSPVPSPDDSDEAISRFGLDDDEYKRNRVAFAGFR